jgi:chromosome segregation ATPase
VTDDMENLRKKNETDTKHNGSTMEGHSNRLQQAEDRISELEDKMEIKGKIEELLVKKLKTWERNMKELTNSIKRPNPRIMGIEEGQQLQQNNNRKFPKPRKSYAYSGIRSLQNNKQT